MTLNALASEIAKRESKKVSVSIGNVREVLRIICAMELEAFDHDGEFDFPTSAIREAVQAKINKRKRGSKT